MEKRRKIISKGVNEIPKERAGHPVGASELPSRHRRHAARRRSPPLPSSPSSCRPYITYLPSHLLSQKSSHPSHIHHLAPSLAPKQPLTSTLFSRTRLFLMDTTAAHPCLSSLFFFLPLRVRARGSSLTQDIRRSIESFIYFFLFIFIFFIAIKSHIVSTVFRKNRQSNCFGQRKIRFVSNLFLSVK